MKSKRSKNKWVLSLNKKTIANLNRREMFRVAGGQFMEDEAVLETACSVCQVSITPATDDFPLFPQLSLIQNRCN
jgi:hypothetical protein